jgi:Putative porin
MSYSKSISPRRVTVMVAFLFGTAAVQPGFAAEPAAPPNVTLTLINRLVERGVLSEEDSADLRLVAEADAAEARAQAALTQAALAQAAAAQARLKAVLAQQGSRRVAAETTSSRSATTPSAEAEETEPLPVPAPRVVRPRASTRVAPAKVATAPKPAVEPPPVEETVPEEAATPASHAVAPASRVARTSTPARVVRAPEEMADATEAPADGSEMEEKVPEDTVRVTYVPEVVKAQLREEIKNEVMDQARQENWASPHAFPDWVSRFRLFGDLRVRYESINFPTGNDNTGAFFNFNAVNTSAPFDTRSNIPFPTYNSDQDRSRLRLRARMGAGIDMGQNYFAGLRLATGENNSPVTQNQSLGSAGSGQGGNFSKYSVWLDRAFLRYETGGLPDQDFSVSLGRFDNPFFATSMIWADDLGFDGAVAQGRFGLGEDVTPFYAVGAFPVFNTDLNFASNQPSKFKSNDKWLYGGQLGVTWELGKNISLKLGAAYYQFENIEGKLSSPIVLFNATDAGDTDASRPAFAQKGNTYMALRNITPVAGEASIGGNQNGSINRFQYFGLATKFAVAAIDARLDFNQFEPFQISFIGEIAKNRSFDSTAIEAVAENNLGAKSTAHPDGEFLGSDTAWLVGVTLGDVALKERWKWNVSLGYRKVGSDALVDGFVDSDFGGGGTNVKGFTLGANLALSSSVRLGLKWMSATQVAGPVFKNDILQLDFNGKF